ncbi:MAG TPA: GNAT family N-acetyltransferase [Rhizomicrobium sp.]|jgi:diamine N-acetyltransferase|nr:GNAT family N-acetyltransferase [Rhizomicrobium sp.]
MTGIEIRCARSGDEAVIVDLLRELAEYERLSHKFHLTRDDVARDFFGQAPRVRCDLALADGEPAGIMTWYHTYATFAARCGIYLEDFYVRTALRQRGIGRALVVDLASRAVSAGIAKMEWSVLAWNKPSIAFYESLHAERVDDWHVYRLMGESLAALARG